MYNTGHIYPKSHLYVSVKYLKNTSLTRSNRLWRDKVCRIGVYIIASYFISIELYDYINKCILQL